MPEEEKPKYKWSICLRCGMPFIPWKEKQVYCSMWCEMLKEKENQKNRRDFSMEDEVVLSWITEYINNIPSNGIDKLWTIASLNGLHRYYEIVPYHKCDVNGICIDKSSYYYAFYEATFFEVDSETGVVLPKNLSLIAIYEDLETAKRRVFTQLRNIDNIIKTYFPSNENHNERSKENSSELGEDCKDSRETSRLENGPASSKCSV